MAPQQPTCSGVVSGVSKAHDIEKTLRMVINFKGVNKNNFWSALEERLKPPLDEVPTDCCRSESHSWRIVLASSFVQSLQRGALQQTLQQSLGVPWCSRLCSEPDRCHERWLVA